MGVEFPMLLKVHDALQTYSNDTDVLCIAQWALLWFSAPTRMNADLVFEGRMVKTYGQGLGKSLGVGFQNADIKDVFLLQHVFFFAGCWRTGFCV